MTKNSNINHESKSKSMKEVIIDDHSKVKYSKEMASAPPIKGPLIYPKDNLVKSRGFKVYATSLNRCHILENVVLRKHR